MALALHLQSFTQITRSITKPMRDAGIVRFAIIVMIADIA